MSQEEIDALDQTTIKRLKGIYELDLQKWQRSYDFTDWSKKFNQTVY